MKKKENSLVKDGAQAPTSSNERIIGTYRGSKKGSSLIFIGGVHGNEPTGIKALQIVFRKLKKSKFPFNGNLYALRGNIAALKKKSRFIDKDLNRLWKYLPDQNQLNIEGSNEIHELKEKEELQTALYKILEEGHERVCVFDLHTTSSESAPFISISDTLRNREIVSDIPAPIVLGLEEMMEGTIFSFLSEIGLSCVLFEGGQHDALSSIDNHEAFIWLMLRKLGCISEVDFPEMRLYYERLARVTHGKRKIYAMKYHYKIDSEEKFEMLPAFLNFQKIHKGEKIAKNERGLIKSPGYGRIFMPLYQKKGSDGFFIIKKIKSIWLGISAIIRKMKLDGLVHFLPGVEKYPGHGDIYEMKGAVNNAFTLKVFHLLGYRKVIKGEDKLRVARRAYDLKDPDLSIIRKNYKRYLG